MFIDKFFLNKWLKYNLARFILEHVRMCIKIIYIESSFISINSLFTI